MPPINEYKCDRCGFALPRGWGGYKYVEVDAQLINARIREKNNEKARLEKIAKEIENLKWINKELLQEIEYLCAKREDWEGTFDKIRRELERVIRGRKLDEIKQEFERETIEIEGTARRFEREIMQGIERLEREIRELEEIEKEIRNRAKIRIECPHPSEEDKVEQILGRNAPPEVRKERTGFNSYCVCLDCLHQFEADLRDEKINEWRLWYGFPDFKEAFRGTPTLKDERKCPGCGSTNVKTEFEVIGKPCPKCKEGIIIEIETGIIS